MANGTIAFDTLQTSDSANTGTSKTLDTSYIFNGVSKAWVNLQGTDTFAIRDSFNLTSATDNGTGDYTFAYTTNMANDNFCAVATVAQDNGEHAVIKARAVGSYTIKTEDGDDGSTASDRKTSSTVHGDLA